MRLEVIYFKLQFFYLIFFRLAGNTELEFFLFCLSLRTENVNVKHGRYYHFVLFSQQYIFVGLSVMLLK